VGVTLKFVESKSSTFQKNLYGFDTIYKNTLSPNSSPIEIIDAKQEAAETATKAKEARDKAAAAKAAAEKALSDKILGKQPLAPSNFGNNFRSSAASLNPITLAPFQAQGVFKGPNFGKQAK
jgi:hypothetical protein